MNIETYKQQREIFQKQTKQYRVQCTGCMQPDFGCYCAHIQKFDPKIKFVVLIHPIEFKRRIATGRMSYQCLDNSELIVGQNYSENSKVNELLKDPRFQPMVLYPGIKSLNLTHASSEKKTTFFDSAKTPLVFVIDGTWATARRMMRHSVNINTLPRFGFTPPGPSQFKVRKQPKAECYSTIEAIHHCIELLGAQVNFDFTGRPHDNLLTVFNKMVERQLIFIQEAFDSPKSTSYRRVKRRIAG